MRVLPPLLVEQEREAGEQVGDQGVGGHGCPIRWCVQCWRLAALDEFGVASQAELGRRFRRMERALDKVQDDLLGPLSAEDRQTLTRLLTRLLTHHQQG
ncbi:hypothetical protein [Nonomuraea sp. MG754425]|uniref:hypothetical protein n=1 Tax=Nonomuraea sp. MG754425 TaxID=2570319 RepID=UPI001F34F8DE|nr:hypothetical protein [Nonomuraea sp. MG754425]